MRRRFGREVWRRWLSEFESSAMTVREFCQDKGVSQNSFYAWKRKLALGEGNGRATFVPVMVVEQPEVKIDLPCGAVLRMPAREDAIGPVLGVLMQLGSGDA